MSWLDEWLFPRRCPVCLDPMPLHGQWICDACRDRLRRIRDPRCMKCGKQLISGDAEFCVNCAGHSRSFIRGIAGFDYGSVPVRRMIAQVKYHNQRQLLDYPCRRMALDYQRLVEGWQVQCLVPVPLHAARRRKRGFNQAGEIAKRLGGVWGIPVETGLLYRTRKTRPQKELTQAARMKNLTDAFSVRAEKACLYDTVALVDDIYTTGSTVEACARVLKRAGIVRVYSIALSAGEA